MNAFVDLEVVVGREEGNGSVDVGVVKDGIGNRVQRAGSATRLGDYTRLIRILKHGVMALLGCLTPCIADESSMLAFGSGLPSASIAAVFLPTNRRLGCFGAAGTSSGTLSWAAGPRFVCALSCSIAGTFLFVSPSLRALMHKRGAHLFAALSRQSGGGGDQMHRPPTVQCNRYSMAHTDGIENACDTSLSFVRAS